MSVQALPNIIFHRELAAVIVFAVVGVVLVDGNSENKARFAHS